MNVLQLAALTKKWRARAAAAYRIVIILARMP